MQDPCTPTIPGFAIVAKIGEGGMGTVFRATQAKTGREVAIKVLTSSEALDSQNRSRFEREARVMTDLAHDNIVRVVEHSSVEGQQYLVMEFVEGRSLRELLTASGGRVAPKKAAELLVGIGAALSCLHEREIVHRDLKPSNILLDRDDKVKLTDFGISSPVAELGDITRTNEFVGSIDYMSPEQRTRLPVDERADQFALGVIAYEMLTGKRPVGTYKPPSRVQPRLHASVDAVVSRALEEDPDDRYADVDEFVQALLAALARTPSRARLVALASTGAVLCAGLVWGVTAWVSDPDKPANDGNGAAVTAPPVKEVVDWIDIADRQLAKGNYDAATQAFDEAIRLDESNAFLLQRRAQVHKRNDMLQLALDDLRVARTLDPELVDAWVGAASIHCKLNDYERAIELLDEAVAKDPGLATAFAWRGWAYHGLERDDLAAKDLEQAIAIDPDCGIAYQWRGFLAKQRLDWPAVKRDYSAFARCNPDDPYARRLIASFLALCRDKKLRDGDLAVEHAHRACVLTQWQDWAALRVLGYAYAEQGDLKSAVEACEKALALAPENRRDLVLGQKTRYERRLEK